MKTITTLILAVLLLAFSEFVSAQSADDIINKYIAARGGKDKLLAIKSMHIEGRIESGLEIDGNFTKITIEVNVVNNKLYRIDYKDNDSYTIVTPDKGWTYSRSLSFVASEIPQEKLKNMQNHLDIVGPFIDYVAKGYKAELIGKDSVDGEEAYKVKLTNNFGKEFTIYIDTKTSMLIESDEIIGIGGQDKSNTQETITHYENYKSVNGIMFSQTMHIKQDRNPISNLYLDKIEVNHSIDLALYKPSDDEMPGKPSSPNSETTREGFDPFLPVAFKETGILTWNYENVTNDKKLPGNIMINGTKTIHEADAAYHGNDGIGAILTSGWDGKVYRATKSGTELTLLDGYSVSNDDYLIFPDGKRQKLSNSPADISISEYERKTGKKYVPEKSTPVKPNNRSPTTIKPTEVYGKAIITNDEMKFENSTDNNTYRIKPYPNLANMWILESKTPDSKGVKKYFLIKVNPDDNSVTYKQEIPAQGASMLFTQLPKKSK